MCYEELDGSFHTYHHGGADAALRDPREVTDQGVRNIKTVMPQIMQAADQWVTAQKGKVVGNYTTLGLYDYVFICELPSDEVVLEGALTFGSQGNVTTHIMRAFPTAEASKIAQRLP